MKKQIAIFLGLLLLFVIGCDEKIPTEVIGTQPEIQTITVPDTIYTEPVQLPLVSVQVVDPQGVADIASVICDISVAATQTVVHTDTLLDNGIDSDILAGDGLFVKRLNPAFAIGKPGPYTFDITVLDAGGHSATQQVSPVVLLDTIENNPPVIANATVPELVDINATGEFIITVQVSDPNGLSDISHVLSQVYAPQSPEVVNQVDTLYDNGQNGDTTPNDGIFATKITNRFARSKVGIFSFRFQAFDQAQRGSNALVKTSKVVNSGNLPPVIANLVAPATLKIDPTQTIQATLEVTASDPQGLGDIQHVFFNSFLPNGNAATNNPFYMSDDAMSGDKIAGDGIYTLTINLPPGMQTGNYTFIFEAVDYSEAHSNTITHVVTVTN